MVNPSAQTGRPLPPDVLNILQRYFSHDSKEARYGPYRLYLDEAETLLEGLLYQIPASDPLTLRGYNLQLYMGLKRVGASLWEQEVRTLMRIARLGHLALPNIIDGGYDKKKNVGGDFDDTGDFAYVVTEQPEATLDEWGEMERLREAKKEALRQLGVLADALSALHLHGVMHRSLSPRAIECFPGSGAGGLDLRLVRFEMSAFVENLFRQPHADEASHREAVRRLLVRQGPDVLAYCAPERLAALAYDPAAEQSPSHTAAQEMSETDRADVYSLGLIAYQWFVGDLDEYLDELDRDETGKPRLKRDDLLATAFGNNRIDTVAAKELRKRWRRRIDLAELTRGQKDLLTKMLDDDWLARPTSGDVCDLVARNYDSWSAAWSPNETSQPFLVAFMPILMRKTVYVWRWVSHDPADQADPTGKLMTKNLIERDLKGGRLVYSPQGFLPYASDGQVDDPASMQDAKYVLLGKTAAWFCQRCRAHTGGPGIWAEVLLIKYAAKNEESSQMDKVRGLYETKFKQSFPEVEAFPLSKSLDRERLGRPSWEPLLAASEVQPPLPAGRVTFESALEFFIKYNQIELESRYYPFRKVSDDGRHIVLEYDKDADDERKRKADTALFAFYLNNVARMDFGDFFRSEEMMEDSAGTAYYYESLRGLRGRKEIGKVQVSAAGGTALTLHVTKLEGQAVPSKGWLRPAADASRQIELARQESASKELVKLGSLVEQMLDPWTIKMLLHRWADAGEELKAPKAEPGDGQAGGKEPPKDGQHFVQEMLRCQPFYALHGPPGTGKTTVVKHAIHALLTREPTARVLVSAQSNFALDNLGERIAPLVRDRGYVLRIASDARRDSNVVSDIMKNHLLRPLTEQLATSIKAHCKKQLERDLPPELAEIVGEWVKYVDASKAELQERVRAAASVVLATCSGATKNNVDRSSGSPLFDWVIVEEAARAWPTEIAIPLIRGFRWALVGDHKQLPAHRMEQIENFLNKCLQSENMTEVGRHGKNGQDYMGIYKFFGELFKKLKEGAAAQYKNLERPLGEMTVQHRMRDPIAQVISNGFYDSTLETAKDAERPLSLDSPPFLASGHALYWLDTSGEEDCFEQEPKWKNVGEARIVRDLVKNLRPFPRANKPPFGSHPLAVVTPYNQQKTLLETYLSDISGDRLLHNVHTIQGREADIVIASLVRTGSHGASMRGNLGFVATSELVNVLLSRARSLLVIVGDFPFFKRCGEQFREEGADASFWSRVCDAVEDHGLILNVGSAVPRSRR